MSLLAGFLRPDSGEILVDGRSVEAYDLEYLRAQIGIVPQHGTLFEGTILENMTLYREGEAIRQAIELSHCLGLSEAVSRLPDGLDTRVGGSAVGALPAGVRQKIVTVRSLVGDPQIILFDDANANLDIKNEQRLMRLIMRLKRERTMVIVSHRPSLLRMADRQFELVGGRLVPILSHQSQAQPSSCPDLQRSTA